MSQILGYLRGLVLASLMLPFLCACSSAADVPYDVQDDGGADQATSLAECESQEFLTTDCADLMAEEADRKQTEQAAITTAKNYLNDFADCSIFDSAEASAETAAACEAAVSLVLDGFDACTALAEEEKYYECSAIENAVNEAVSLCDASSEEVTTDFCELVNPTTDDAAESS